MFNLTPEQLLAAHPSCTKTNATLHAPALSAAMAADGIDTKNEICYFLAQLLHETGGFNWLIENLNYTASGLMTVWPHKFPTLDFATQYAHNQEKIANYVYANILGNGDEASGDGFRYRGRGDIQLTGKNNYIKAMNATGIDLISYPDLLTHPDVAAKVAAWYWKSNNLNFYADSGNFPATTKAINGGLVGEDDREKIKDRLLAVINL